ncbi:MAG: FtsX-like permease family protein [Rhodocyclaceae bacterium]|nr:FtsX-like permease family protein [Rhodocyclaceae bacterium]
MTNLAARMLLRDWRAGELGILALALVTAVASVTSVSFFADRVRASLYRDAHQLLGADVVLIADHSWKKEIRDEIPARGLKRAETATFISMARAGERNQLVSMKAVSAGYPLRGKLRVAPALNTPDAETDALPAPGTVWIDERLALALAVKAGDAIDLGDARFGIGGILTQEPDRGINFFNIAPRLMLRLEDVPATGLIQNGSRVEYRLMVAGGDKQVRDFQKWVQPRLGRGESVTGLDNARPEIRNSLDRAQKFVGLGALLAVVLAAVAVSLATRRYSSRHLDGYAVMRCFGASQSRLFGLFAAEFGLLGLLASMAGCLIGYFAQFAIASFAPALLGKQLAQPSLAPALQGLLTGLVLLLGFALPPLMRLKNVPALRVIRRDLGSSQESALPGYSVGFVAIAGLLMWQAGEVKLGVIVLGGFTLALVVFGLLAFAALHLVGSMSAAANASWRYGLANLRRRARTNAVQIIALSLALAVMLLLSFTRNDLLQTWRNKVPPHAPNRFIINIQPEQAAPIERFLADNGVPAPDLYPMVRGRYVAKNGEAVQLEAYDERARRLAEREFNLSYLQTIPAHNSISAGRAFSADDLAQGALSVEEGIAEQLGWKLGDRLTWQVAGRTIAAPIVSLRRLEWDSMRVNFFVVATPGLLKDAPRSFITSFYLPEARAPIVGPLVQRFPNISVIDATAIVRQAQSMTDEVVRAVQFVFLFALAAGVIVLYAALRATQDERVAEAAVMRALGASRSQVLSAQRTEFAAIGLLAGLLAATTATFIGWAIAYFAFHFPYHANGWVWIAGPALGLLCVIVNAAAGARAALARPPILALREN